VGEGRSQRGMFVSLHALRDGMDADLLKQYLETSQSEFLTNPSQKPKPKKVKKPMEIYDDDDDDGDQDEEDEEDGEMEEEVVTPRGMPLPHDGDKIEDEFELEKLEEKELQIQKKLDITYIDWPVFKDLLKK
jgi:hypothetical protein